MKRKNVFPEAIPRDDLKPGPWTIQNQNQGAVNLHDKRMSVPLVDMPCPCGVNHSEGMRVHEYGHVAFTPINGPEIARNEGLDHGLVNGCEDARLKVRLEEAMGEELPAPSCPGQVPALLTQYLTSGNFPDLLRAYAGAHGSNGTKEIARDWVGSIEAHDPSLKGIGEVMRSADDVMDELQRDGKYSEDPSLPLFRDTIIAAKKLNYLAKAMQAVMDAIRAKAEEEARKANEEQATEEDAGDLLVEVTGDGTAPGGKIWGDMMIERAPLSKPARAYPSRKWTARDEGVHPSAIHRIATDGRIFKQPAHRPEPLTVLVDCSGSMSWDSNDLQMLLDKLPATTVALYSGDGVEGKLRIVAEKGKRAEAGWIRAPLGGSNTVDGLALRWLAKHKGKKLWVSDGLVNGAGGSGNELHRDATGIVTKYKIMRVNHHPEAMEVITRKRPFKPSSRMDATGDFMHKKDVIR